jgi:uncharacterized protein YdhG (YjbR/CyaY superfamily)
MPPAKPPPASIDDYIAAFPPDVQARLQQIRRAIRAAAPDAAEAISYGIPTFKLDGRYLIYFAGFKKHLSVYPAPLGVPEFAAAVEKYGAGKGTLQFPLNQPTPLDLITRLTAHRLAEHAKSAKGKSR